MPSPLYVGFRVFLRHYPSSPFDILFNGSPILNDKVCVILEDSRLDAMNPIKTCLGYLDFLNVGDTAGLFLTAVYENDFEFYIRQHLEDTIPLYLETQFKVLNSVTFGFPVSFQCEVSASTFWGLSIGGGVGSAPTPFNFLDLNGNCGTLKNGTIVTVTDKEGEYIVRSSQIFWNDNTKNSNMIIYYLEQDGCFMYSPDCHATKKKVV